MHHPITAIFADQQELLCKIGSQFQRDFREIMGLRKPFSSPRNYASNTLPIIYKIIERHQKEQPSMVSFMTEEEWASVQRRDAPLYAGVFTMQGHEHFVRGIPFGTLLLYIYYQGSLTYVMVFDPISAITVGVEKGGGSYIVGGPRVRDVCTPKSEKPSCVWGVYDPVPPNFPMDIYVLDNPVLAAMWVVMSRASVSVFPKEVIPEGLWLFLKESPGFLDVREDQCIFGEEKSVKTLLDHLL